MQRLTPPELRFQVLTPPPIQMRPGTRIDYRLRVHGVPVRWQSEITVWEPSHRFVDEQRRGPYRFWRHEHRFVAQDGGTLATDQVQFAAPGGALVERLLIERDLRGIFAYRQQQLAKQFPERVAAVPSPMDPLPADPPVATPSGAAGEEAFVLSLARALHSAGAPSHRLEDALEQVSRSLGLAAQFFSVPTSVFASISRGGRPRTTLLRTEPGDVDLGRLSELYGVIRLVLAHRVPVEQAQRRLDAIVGSPRRYGRALTLLSFAVASASAARFFGGGLRETAVTFLIGMVMGGLAVAAGRLRVAARLFEPLGAALAALGAAAAAALWAPVAADLVTIAGLIVLVPGFTFTIAMTELAVRHLASGTARMASALTVFLAIGFGVAMGNRLGRFLFDVPPATAAIAPDALPAWTLWASLLLAPLAFTVLFSARAKDAPLIVASCGVAFWGGRLGARVLDPQLGVFVGAVLVGVLGNVYARIVHRPASVPIVPGLLLLVPGSIGLRSLSSLLAQDVLTGMQAAFTMTLVSVALAMGLLVANVLVPPRSAL
jgi:uncharacterized membrane protein YjjP (DUF1212 family)/ligand-binding SRPBCC domain-containing protein